MKRRTAGLAALTALFATPALAHTGVGATHGVLSGLAHPLLGPDHVAAMVAVGLWAGLIGGRAIWVWPAAFVGVMALGAAAALLGLPLAGVGTGVILSVLLLGLAVALRAPLPVALGALACGSFAVFHGYAHGAELPAGAGVLGYGAGFLAATALLHALGVGLGLGVTRLDQPWLPRLMGGAVALTGLALLIA